MNGLHSSLLPEHVHLKKNIYIYIYEMGYCYVKINVHIISAVIQDIHNMF